MPTERRWRACLETLGEQPLRLHSHIDRLVGDLALLIRVEQAVIDQLSELIQGQSGASCQLVEPYPDRPLAVCRLPSPIWTLAVLAPLPHGQLRLDDLEREVLVTLQLEDVAEPLQVLLVVLAVARGAPGGTEQPLTLEEPHFGHRDLGELLLEEVDCLADGERAVTHRPTPPACGIAR